MEALVTQLCLTLCDTMDCRLPTPLSMGFSRQEYWSGCHSLLQGIFPTKRSNPASASQADPLPSEPPGVLHHKHIHTHLKKRSASCLKYVMCIICVSCSVVSDSMRPHDSSPPSPSVHGILQARILEWVAIYFSNIIYKQCLFVRSLVAA